MGGEGGGVHRGVHLLPGSEFRRRRQVSPRPISGGQTAHLVLASLTRRLSTFTTDGEATPFNSLLQTQRVLSTAAYNQESFPTVIIPDVQVQMMVFQGDQVYMDDFRRMIAFQLSSCDALLDELLLGVTVPEVDLSSLRDDWGDKTVGHSFLHDPSNGLQAHSHLLLSAVLHDRGLRPRFFSRMTSDSVLLSHANVVSYLERCGEFLSKLSAAILVTCGNSPRGPEFAGTQVHNTPYSMRNVLVQGGSILLYHTRQKPQQITGHGKVSSLCVISVPVADLHLLSTSTST